VNDKFEYWAKREGLDCAISGDDTSTYKNGITEGAYLGWCNGLSESLSEQYSKYNERLELREFVLRNKGIKADIFIQVTNRVKLAILNDIEQFKKSKVPVEDYTYINSRVELAFDIIQEQLLIIDESIGITRLISGVVSKDYPKKTKKIQDALNKLNRPLSWGFGLESTVSAAVTSGLFIKSELEVRFNDDIVIAALELNNTTKD
jgi:hypothetical protein